ncbi:MAG: hypothetical protein WCE46_03855 [Methanoregula sp.]|uniref:hypothetical protein n=1 Tax=Methanoregula sp. TaxID=2052170 RepID=UPI003C72B31F
MSCRAGFVWETPQHFVRYIEDCGVPCELVTPYMLAAPFFRGSFTCLIIPTGFANPAFCRLLPALRASSERIENFVENGGNLLVFGAAIDRADAYDWLPFPVTYQHEVFPRTIACGSSELGTALVEDYDPSCIECDGIFPAHGGNAAGESDGSTVIIENMVGKGRVIVTSVHEYPSRAFVKKFCASGTQTLF